MSLIVSRTVENGSKTYIEVLGKPFFYNSVQSWFPPEEDYYEYVKKASEVGYKSFTFWLYWKHLEGVEGNYNWRELEKIIGYANIFDLYLDIVWSGTLFCDHMDRRFSPAWVMENEAYHLKDSEGKRVLVDGRDMGMCPALDTTNVEILEKEKNILKK